MGLLPVRNRTSSTTQSTATLATDAIPPTVRERLYLNRFGTGFTPAALAQLRAAGTPEAWLAAQLKPGTVPEAAKVADVDAWFAPLRRSPAEKYATDAAKTKTGWSYGQDLGNWSLLRRMYSQRTVLETMVEFWSNTLHVPIQHERAWIHRFDYDATIRANALGSFEKLLLACALHPAMRLYLDNWRSVRDAPNENQGRELLEVHTVGRESGYTEAMVKSSAAILSGYTVDWGAGTTFQGRYDATAHTTGPVNVLGFSNANASADGQAVTVAYLKYLARHPSTARQIARKLATYFVSDTPSAGLIDELARVYTTSGTNISSVMKALGKHPEFLTSQTLKARTPMADLVATARVLGVDVQAPLSANSWANAANLVHGADRVFSWPRPDGAPLLGTAWCSASRMFASYRMHQDQAGGFWPTEAVSYRSGGSWLTGPSMRFDAFVDHLCLQWLGKPADARLLLAATQAVTGPQTWAVVTAATQITPTHGVATWLFPRLTAALLDTPDHMTT
jgi:hypothetical protein